MPKEVLDWREIQLVSRLTRNRKIKGDKSMAEKHIRLKSVYKRDMRDQRRGMVKAKLL